MGVTATARTEVDSVLWRCTAEKFREVMEPAAAEGISLGSAPYAERPKYPWPSKPPEQVPVEAR